MSDLPPGWKWATLDNLAGVDPRAITDGPFGSNLKSSHYSSSGARVLRLQNIGDGVFRDEVAFIELEHFEKLRAHEAQCGDLLVASLGGDPPRSCMVPPLGVPAIVKADCIRVRLSPHMNAKWVLYALCSPQLKAQAASLLKGVGRPRLGLAQIRALRIPVAPLLEQHRVVATLDEHLSRLDAASVVSESALRNLRFARESALAAAVNEPAAASWTTLSEVTTDVRYGTSIKCTYNGVGPAVLRIPNVQSGRIDLSDLKYALADTPELAKLTVQREDLFVIRTNGAKRLIGRTAVAQRDMNYAFASYLIRYRFDKSRVTPAWIQLCLESPSLRREVEERAASSAGQYNLSIAKLSGLIVPIPPMQTQERVLKHLLKLSESLSRLESHVGAMQQTARGLRRSLLAAAFGGNLGSQDPADEPASVLLDRIRAERAAVPKPKRGRRGPRPDPAQEVLQ